MQKYFEKIKERLEERQNFYERRFAEMSGSSRDLEDWGSIKSYKDAIEIANQVAEEYATDTNVGNKDGWIPVSSGKMPKVEETVYIVAKRKYKDGSFRYIYTSAIYEDGTVRENDSRWNWEEIVGEWDEDEECLIIPEGWFEDKQYNPEGVINYNVDDEVVAWKPITPYQPKGE